MVYIIGVLDMNCTKKLLLCSGMVLLGQLPLVAMHYDGYDDGEQSIRFELNSRCSPEVQRRFRIDCKVDIAMMNLEPWIEQDPSITKKLSDEARIIFTKNPSASFRKVGEELEKIYVAIMAFRKQAESPDSLSPDSLLKRQRTSQ